MVMRSPPDCYGSPPPETQEELRSHTKKTPSSSSSRSANTQQFATITPATVPSCRLAQSNSQSSATVNTSARATRGQNTAARSNSPSVNNGTAGGNPQTTPRQLLVSPKPSVASSNQEVTMLEPEPYLLNLPASLLPHWCALVLFTSLSIAATASGTPLTPNSQTIGEADSEHHQQDMHMVLAILTLCLTFSLIAAVCYIAVPAKFVGSLYEVMVIGLNLIMWSGSLPIIMNPQNNLAVQGSSIVNGNLFVLSWGTFLLSCVLLKLVIEQLHVMDQARSGNLMYLTPSRKEYPPMIPITPSRLAHICLVLSSLVVLVASARNYKHQICSDRRQICRRLTFVICVSVMSLMGLFMSWGTFFVLNRNVSREGNNAAAVLIPTVRIRLALMSVLAFGWFLATSTTTFGRHAPGHALGNVFLGTWTAVFLSSYLLKKTLAEYLNEQYLQKIKKKKLSAKEEVPGLVQDNSVAKATPKPPISTKPTEDFERFDSEVRFRHFMSPQLNITTGMVSPKTFTQPITASNSKVHSTISSISLAPSPEIDDPEKGLRHSYTASTEPEEFVDDDHGIESASTEPRGSSSRTATPPTGYGTCKSTLTGGTSQSAGDDARSVRSMPTPIPFIADEVYDGDNHNITIYDDDEDSQMGDGYGHSLVDTSAMTTAIDNRTCSSSRDILDTQDM